MIISNGSLAVEQFCKEAMNDPVQSPSHYTGHPSGIECWQITAHLPHAMAAAFEYVWRYREKNGAQDLQKALKWCEFERKARTEITTRAHVPEIARARMSLIISSPSDVNVFALWFIFDSAVHWMNDHLLRQAETSIHSLLSELSA